MRWGAGDARRFVRPVRGVLALLGGRVVPMELFGVAGGRPHGRAPDPLRRRLRRDRARRLPREAARAASSSPIRRRAASRILEDARASRRRGRRLDRGQRRPRQHAGRPRRVARASCAAPSRRSSWSCPRRSRSTAMRTHQKFLPVRGPAGLLPHFIAVMDNAEDRKGFIAKGCEWVLNARLADARFFYEDDVRAQPRVAAAAARAADVPGQARRLPRRRRRGIQDLAEAIAVARRPRRTSSRRSAPRRCSPRPT